MANVMTIRLAIFLTAALAASAAEIIISLPGAQSVSKKVVQYRCDANAPKLGLPTAAFPVEYINAGGNSLAVLPIANQQLIFAGVTSGSGALYAAQNYIWWEAAGRRISLRSETQGESVCQRVDSK